MALKTGCFLNIDSGLDAKLTSELADELGVRAKVFLRVNSDSETCSDVHSYNQTSTSDSKFGVGLAQLEEV